MTMLLNSVYQRRQEKNSRCLCSETMCSLIEKIQIYNYNLAAYYICVTLTMLFIPSETQ